MSTLKKIKIDDIVANPYQPRTVFEDEALAQLAASIRENGLLQPIVVRENRHHYEIIAGERRFRACQLNGMHYIDALVIKADETQSATLALLENIQRENLSVIEEANAYVQMIRLTGKSQGEIASQLGKQQSTISNKIRLLNLSEEMQQAISSSIMSERHGRALLSIENEETRQKLFERIVSEHLTVKQTEDFIRFIQAPKPKKAKIKNRCYGVAYPIIANTFKKTVKDVSRLDRSVVMNESEDDDHYYITISINKHK